MGVGIFWIGLNRDDLGCWRLTLRRLRSDLLNLKFENQKSALL